MTLPVYQISDSDTFVEAANRFGDVKVSRSPTSLLFREGNLVRERPAVRIQYSVRVQTVEGPALWNYTEVVEFEEDTGRLLFDPKTSPSPRIDKDKLTIVRNRAGLI